MAAMSKGASDFILTAVLGAIVQVVLRGRLGTSSSMVNGTPSLSTSAPRSGHSVYALPENDSTEQSIARRVAGCPTHSRVSNEWESDHRVDCRPPKAGRGGIKKNKP